MMMMMMMMMMIIVSRTAGHVLGFVGLSHMDSRPSKHVGSDSDRLGSVGQKRRTGLLHTCLLLNLIRLAKTRYCQPEPNRTRAGFEQSQTERGPYRINTQGS